MADDLKIQFQEQKGQIDTLKEMVREREELLQKKDKELQDTNAKLSKVKLQAKAKLAKDARKGASKADETEKHASEVSTDDGMTSDQGGTKGKLLQLRKKIDEKEKIITERDNLIALKETQIEAKTFVISEKDELIKNLMLQLEDKVKFAESFDKADKENIDEKDTQNKLQEMYAQMVYKDKKLMELNNKILEQDRTVMDLQELVGEKNEVINGRDKVVKILQETIKEKEQHSQGQTIVITKLTGKVENSEEVISSLKELLEKAEHDLRIETEKFHMKITETQKYFEETIQDRDAENEKIRTKLKSKETDLSTAENDLCDLLSRHEKEVEKIMMHSDVGRDDIVNLLEQKLKDLNEVLSGKIRVIEVLQTESSAKDKELLDMSNTAKSLKEKLQLTSEQLLMLQTEYSDLETQLKQDQHKNEMKMKSVQEKYEQEKSEKDLELQAYQSTLSQFESSYNQAVAQYSTLQERYTQAYAENQALLSRLNDVDSKQPHPDSLSESSRKDHSRLEKEVADLKAQLEARSMELAEKQRELDVNLEDTKKLRKLVKSDGEDGPIAAETDKLSSKIKTLESEIEELRQSNELVDEVVRLRNHIAELEDDKGNLQLKLVDFEETIALQAQLEEQIHSMENKLKYVCEERESAVSELNSTKQEKEEMNQVIQELQKTDNQRQHDQDSFEGSLIKEQKDKIVDLKSMITQLHDEKEQEKRIRISAESQLIEYEDYKRHAETDIDEMTVKIASLQSEIENFSELVKARENRISEIESQRVSLEIRMAEMEESKEGDANENEVLQNEIGKLREKIDNQNQPVIAFEKENEELQKSLEQERNTNLEMENNIQQLQTQVEDLERIGTELAENMKDKEKTEKEFLSQIHEYQERVETYETEKQAAETQHQIVLSECVNLLSQVANLEQSLVKKDVMLGDLQKKIDMRDSEVKQFCVDISDGEHTAITELFNYLQDKFSCLSKLTEDYNLKICVIENLESSLELANETIDSLRKHNLKEIEEMSSNIHSLEMDIQNLNETVFEKERTIVEIHQLIESREKELSESKQSISLENSRFSEIEHELDAKDKELNMLREEMCENTKDSDFKIITLSDYISNLERDLNNQIVSNRLLEKSKTKYEIEIQKINEQLNTTTLELNTKISQEIQLNSLEAQLKSSRQSQENSEELLIEKLESEKNEHEKTKLLLEKTERQLNSIKENISENEADLREKYSLVDKLEKLCSSKESEISKYIDKLNDLNQQLVTCTEERNKNLECCHEKESQLFSVQESCDSLKEQCHQLQNVIEIISNERDNLSEQINGLQLNCEQKDVDFQNLSDEHISYKLKHEQTVKDKNIELESLKNNLQKMSEKLTESEKQHFDIEQLHINVEKLSKENLEYQKLLTDSKHINELTEKEKHDVEAKLEESQAKVRQLSIDLDILLQEKDSSTTAQKGQADSLNSLEKERDSLKNKVSDLEELTNTKHAEIVSVRSVLCDVKVLNETLEAEKCDLILRISDLEHDCESLNADVLSLSSVIHTCKSDFTSQNDINEKMIKALCKNLHDLYDVIPNVLIDCKTEIDNPDFPNSDVQWLISQHGLKVEQIQHVLLEYTNHKNDICLLTHENRKLIACVSSLENEVSEKTVINEEMSESLVNMSEINKQLSKNIQQNELMIQDLMYQKHTLEIQEKAVYEKCLSIEMTAFSQESTVKKLQNTRYKLEKAVAKMQNDYLSISRQLCECHSQLEYKDMSILKTNVHLSDIQSELDEMKNENEALRSELEECKEHLTGVVHELVLVTGKHEDCKTKLLEAEDQITTFVEKCSAAEEKLAEVQATSVELSTKLAESLCSLNDKSQKLEMSESELRKVRQYICDCEYANRCLEQQQKENQEELNQLKINLNVAEENSKQLKDEFVEQAAVLKASESQLEITVKALTKTKQKLVECEAVLETTQTDRDSFQDSFNGCDNELSKYQVKLDVLLEKQTETTTRLHLFEEINSSLKNEIGTYKEERIYWKNCYETLKIDFINNEKKLLCVNEELREMVMKLDRCLVDLSEKTVNLTSYREQMRYMSNELYITKNLLESTNNLLFNSGNSQIQCFFDEKPSVKSLNLPAFAEDKNSTRNQTEDTAKCTLLSENERPSLKKFPASLNVVESTSEIWQEAGSKYSVSNTVRKLDQPSTMSITQKESSSVDGIPGEPVHHGKQHLTEILPVEIESSENNQTWSFGCESKDDTLKSLTKQLADRNSTIVSQKNELHEKLSLITQLNNDIHNLQRSLKNMCTQNSILNEALSNLNMKLCSIENSNFIFSDMNLSLKKKLKENKDDAKDKDMTQTQIITEDFCLVLKDQLIAEQSKSQILEQDLQRQELLLLSMEQHIHSEKNMKFKLNYESNTKCISDKMTCRECGHSLQAILSDMHSLACTDCGQIFKELRTNLNVLQKDYLITVESKNVVSDMLNDSLMENLALNNRMEQLDSEYKSLQDGLNSVKSKLCDIFRECCNSLGEKTELEIEDRNLLDSWKEDVEDICKKFENEVDIIDHDPVLLQDNNILYFHSEFEQITVGVNKLLRIKNKEVQLFRNNTRCLMAKLEDTVEKYDSSNQTYQVLKNAYEEVERKFILQVSSQRNLQTFLDLANNEIKKLKLSFCEKENLIVELNLNISALSSFLEETQNSNRRIQSDMEDILSKNEDLKKELDEANRKNQEYVSKMSDFENSSTLLSEELLKKEHQIETLTNEIMALQKECAEIKIDLESVRDDSEKSQFKLKHTMNCYNELEQQVSDLNSRNLELTDNFGKQTKEYEDLLEEVKVLKCEQSEKEERTNSLEDLSNTLSSEKETLNRELSNCKEKLENYENEVQKLNIKCDELQRCSTQNHANYCEMQSELQKTAETLTQNTSDLENKLHSVIIERDELTSTVDDITSQLNRFQELVIEKDSQLEILTLRYHDAEKEIFVMNRSINQLNIRLHEVSKENVKLMETVVNNDELLGALQSVCISAAGKFEIKHLKNIASSSEKNEYLTDIYSSISMVSENEDSASSHAFEDTFIRSLLDSVEKLCCEKTALCSEIEDLKSSVCFLSDNYDTLRQRQETPKMIKPVENDNIGIDELGILRGFSLKLFGILHSCKENLKMDSTLKPPSILEDVSYNRDECRNDSVSQVASILSEKSDAILDFLNYCVSLYNDHVVKNQHILESPVQTYDRACTDKTQQNTERDESDISHSPRQESLEAYNDLKQDSESQISILVHQVEMLNLDILHRNTDICSLEKQNFILHQGFITSKDSFRKLVEKIYHYSHTITSFVERASANIVPSRLSDSDSLNADSIDQEMAILHSVTHCSDQVMYINIHSITDTIYERTTDEKLAFNAEICLIKMKQLIDNCNLKCKDLRIENSLSAIEIKTLNNLINEKSDKINTLESAVSQFEILNRDHEDNVCKLLNDVENCNSQIKCLEEKYLKIKKSHTDILMDQQHLSDMLNLLTVELKKKLQKRKDEAFKSDGCSFIDIMEVAVMSNNAHASLNDTDNARSNNDVDFDNITFASNSKFLETENKSIMTNIQCSLRNIITFIKERECEIQCLETKCSELSDYVSHLQQSLKVSKFEANGMCFDQDGDSQGVNKLFDTKSITCVNESSVEDMKRISFSAKYEHLHFQIADLKQDLEKKENDIVLLKVMLEERSDKFSKEMSDFTLRESNYDEERMSLLLKIDNLIKDSESQKAQVIKHDEIISDMTCKLEDKERKFGDLKKQIRKKDGKIASLNKNLNELKEKFEVLKKDDEEKVNIHQTLLTDKENQLADLITENTNLKCDLNDRIEDIRCIDTKVEELEKEIQSAYRDNACSQDVIYRLQHSNAVFQDQISEQNDNLSESRQIRIKLERDVEQMKKTEFELTSVIKKYTDDREIMLNQIQRLTTELSDKENLVQSVYSEKYTLLSDLGDAQCQIKNLSQHLNTSVSSENITVSSVQNKEDEISVDGSLGFNTLNQSESSDGISMMIPDKEMEIQQVEAPITATQVPFVETIQASSTEKATLPLVDNNPGLDVEKLKTLEDFNKMREEIQNLEALLARKCEELYYVDQDLRREWQNNSDLKFALDEKNWALESLEEQVQNSKEASESLLNDFNLEKNRRKRLEEDNDRLQEELDKSRQTIDETVQSGGDLEKYCTSLSKVIEELTEKLQDKDKVVDSIYNEKYSMLTKLGEYEWELKCLQEKLGPSTDLNEDKVNEYYVFQKEYEEVFNKNKILHTNNNELQRLIQQKDLEILSLQKRLPRKIYEAEDSQISLSQSSLETVPKTVDTLKDSTSSISGGEVCDQISIDSPIPIITVKDYSTDENENVCSKMNFKVQPGSYDEHIPQDGDALTLMTSELLSLKEERNKLIEELAISKTKLEDIQHLYSDASKQQGDMEADMMKMKKQSKKKEARVMSLTKQLESVELQFCDEIQQKEHKLTEYTQEVETLLQQIKKKEEHIATQAENLHDLSSQLEYLNSTHADKSDETSYLSQKVSDLRQALERKREDYLADIQVKDEQIQYLKSEIDTLNNKLTSAHKDLEEARANLELLSQELETKSECLSNIQTELNDMKVQKDNLEQVLFTKNQYLEALEADLTNMEYLKRDLDEKTRHLEELSSTWNKLQEENHFLHNEIVSKNNDVFLAENKIKQLTNDLDMVHQQLQEGEQHHLMQLGTFEEEKQILIDKLHLKTSSIESLETDHSDLQAKLSQKSKVLQQLQIQVDELTAELQLLKESNKEDQRNIKDLEANVDSIQNDNERLQVELLEKQQIIYQMEREQMVHSDEKQTMATSLQDQLIAVKQKEEMFIELQDEVYVKNRLLMESENNISKLQEENNSLQSKIMEQTEVIEHQNYDVNSYIESINELNTEKNQLISTRNELQHIIDDHHLLVSQKEEHVSGLVEQVESLHRSFTQKEDMIRNQEQQLASFVSTKNDLLADIQNKTDIIDQLQSNLSAALQQIENLQIELSQNSSASCKMEDEIIALQSSVSVSTSRLEEKQQQHLQIEEELKQTLLEQEYTKEQLAESNREGMSLSRQLSDKQFELDMLQQETIEKNRFIEEIQCKIVNTQSENEHLKDINHNKEECIQNLHASLNMLESKYTSLNAEFLHSQDIIHNLQSSLESQTRQLEYSQASANVNISKKDIHGDADSEALKVTEFDIIKPDHQILVHASHSDGRLAVENEHAESVHTEPSIGTDISAKEKDDLLDKIRNLETVNTELNEKASHLSVQLKKKEGKILSLSKQVKRNQTTQVFTDSASQTALDASIPEMMNENSTQQSPVNKTIDSTDSGSCDQSEVTVERLSSIQKILNDKEEQLEMVTQQKISLEADSAKQQEAINDLQLQNQMLMEDHTKLMLTMENESKNLLSSNETIDELNLQVQRYAETAGNLQADLDSMHSVNTENKTKLSQMEEANASLESQVTQMENDLHSWKEKADQLQHYSQTLEAQNESTTGLQERLEEVENTLVEKNTIISNLQDAFNVFGESEQSLKSELQRKDSQLLSLSETVKEGERKTMLLEETIQEMEVQQSEKELQLNNRLQALHVTCEQKDTQIEELMGNEKLLVDSSEKIKTNIEELIKQIQEKDESIETLNRQVSENSGVQESVLRENEEKLKELQSQAVAYAEYSSQLQQHVQSLTESLHDTQRQLEAKASLHDEVMVKCEQLSVELQQERSEHLSQKTISETDKQNVQSTLLEMEAQKEEVDSNLNAVTEMLTAERSLVQERDKTITQLEEQLVCEKESLKSMSAQISEKDEIIKNSQVQQQDVTSATQTINELNQQIQRYATATKQMQTQIETMDAEETERKIKMTQLEESNTLLNTQISKLEYERDTWKDKAEHLEDTTKTFDMEQGILDASQKKVEALERDVLEKENIIRDLQETISSYGQHEPPESVVIEKENLLSSAVEDAVEKDNKIKSLELMVQELENKMSEEISLEESNLVEYSTKIKELNNIIEQKDARIKELQDSQNQKEITFKKALASVKILKSREQESKETSEKLKQQIEVLTEQVEEKNERIENLNKTLSDKTGIDESVLMENERKVNELQSQATAYSEYSSQLQQHVQSLTESLHDTQTQLKAKSTALDALVIEKDCREDTLESERNKYQLQITTIEEENKNCHHKLVELEDQKKNAELQVETLVENLSIEKSLVHEKNQYIDELESQLANDKESLKLFNEQLAEKDDVIRDYVNKQKNIVLLNETIEAKEEKINEIFTDLTASREMLINKVHQLSKQEDDIVIKDKKIISLEQDICSVKENLNRETEEKAMLQTRIYDCLQTIETLQCENTKLKEDVTDKLEALEMFNKEKADVDTKCKEIHLEMDNLREKLDMKANDLNQKESIIRKLEEDARLLSQENKCLKEESDLQTAVSVTDKTPDDVSRLAELEEQNRKLEEIFGQTERERDGLIEEINICKKEVFQCSQDLSEKDHNTMMLENTLLEKDELIHSLNVKIKNVEETIVDKDNLLERYKVTEKQWLQDMDDAKDKDELIQCIKKTLQEKEETIQQFTSEMQKIEEDNKVSKVLSDQMKLKINELEAGLYDQTRDIHDNNITIANQQKILMEKDESIQKLYNEMTEMQNEMRNSNVLLQNQLEQLAHRNDELEHLLMEANSSNKKLKSDHEKLLSDYEKLKLDGTVQEKIFDRIEEQPIVEEMVQRSTSNITRSAPVMEDFIVEEFVAKQEAAVTSLNPETQVDASDQTADVNDMKDKICLLEKKYSKQVADYESVQNKLQVTEVKFGKMLTKLKAFKEKNDKLEANVDNLSSQLNLTEIKNRELIESKIKTEDDLNLEKDKYKKLENDFVNLKEEFDSSIVSSDQSEHTNLDYQTLQTNFNELKKSCAELESSLEYKKNFEEKYKHLQTSHTELGNMLQLKEQQFQNELTQMKSQCETLNVQIEANKLKYDECIAEKESAFQQEISELFDLKSQHSMILKDNEDFQKLVDNLKEANTSLRNEADNLRRSVHELQSQLSDDSSRKTKITSLEEKISEMEADRIHLEEEIEGLREDMITSKKDKALLKEEIKSLNSKLQTEQKMSEDVSNLNEQLQQLKVENQFLRDEIDGLNWKLEELTAYEEELEKAQTQIQELEDSKFTFEVEIKQLKIQIEQIDPLRKETEDLHSQIHSYENEREIYENELLTLRNKLEYYEPMEKELEATRSELVSKERSCKSLKDEINSLNQKNQLLTHIEDTNKSIVEEIKVTKAESSDFKREVYELRSKVKAFDKVEEEYNTMCEQYNKILADNSNLAKQVEELHNKLKQYGMIEKEIISEKEQREHVEREKITLTGRVDELQSQNQLLAEEGRQLRQKSVDVQNEMQKLDFEYKSLKSQLEVVSSGSGKLNKFQSEYENLQTQFTKAVEQKNKIQLELNQANYGLQQREARCQQLAMQISQLAEDRSYLNIQLSHYSKSMREKEQMAEEVQNQYTVLYQAHMALQAKMAETEKRALADVRNRVSTDTLQTENEELHKQLSESKQMYEDLSQSHEAVEKALVIEKERTSQLRTSFNEAQEHIELQMASGRLKEYKVELDDDDAEDRIRETQSMLTHHRWGYCHRLHRWIRMKNRQVSRVMRLRPGIRTLVWGYFILLHIIIVGMMSGVL